MTSDSARALDAAVAEIGGTPRAGQQQMADAVASSIADGVHLLVQAGTGTGKSLGYLVPILLHAAASGQRVVVATATIALQNQLATADIPTALAAVEQVGGKRPRAAVLKGRTNYACLLRSRSGGPEQDSLFGAAEIRAEDAGPESALGAEVLALREWIEQQASDDGLADRDEAPTHTARGWQQVSIPTRECVGAINCPFGSECFVEKSRERARDAQLVVTNHALLAINAMHGGTALPDHDVVVIDEAHELVSRVTSAATAELSPALIERIGKRAMSWLDDEVALDLLESADELRQALDEGEPGRVSDGAPILRAFEIVRDTARAALTDLKGGETELDKTQASAAVQELFDIAARMATLADADVVWVSDSELLGRTAHVAPLNVAGLMRDKVFGERTTVLTSATLALGGSFTPVAASVGLRSADEVRGDGEPDSEWAWRGIDVGSPFDYPRQGILYIARELPPPGRDGIGADTLAQIAELVWAAGGRTLGLFASRRAAETAAVHVRRELPELTVLCQGDAQLSELTRRFVAEPDSCLFGTVSLWQGVDVPGETCQLVIIDKIPFPRPDDPLMQARQKAVADAGGNGFMSVAATHAALLLAQGSGRLIRRLSDRGLVAVLDPRLASARYGSFLRASMPDFWTTTDYETAVASLRRLAADRDRS